MAQTNTIGRVATKIIRDNETTKVRYHWTDVVTFTKDKIILDSGRYHTQTTKTRMNQTANQFDLGFNVYQENFEWFVVVNRDFDNPIKFYDGMVLER